MSEMAEEGADNVATDRQREFRRDALDMFGGEVLAAAAFQHKRDMETGPLTPDISRFVGKLNQLLAMEKPDSGEGEKET